MSVDRPLVTVVMPAFRMGAYIADALESVAAQTYPAWEVIIVDDHAPEDGTHGIVKHFAERFPGVRVELIRHERNQGVSAARNTGITAAKGEFVAFLDPDDAWFPEHLAKLVEQFRVNGEVDVATGPVEIFSDGPGGSPSRISELTEWQVSDFPASLAMYNFIQPSASVVRRSALLAVGGFDTDPSLQHIEDYDLWIRLVGQGSTFAFLLAPTSRYRKHAGGATNDKIRMQTLHDRLTMKHSQFFRSANARSLYLLMERNRIVKEELIRTKIELNGPLFRTVKLLDSFLRGVVRSIRKVIP